MVYSDWLMAELDSCPLMGVVVFCVTADRAFPAASEPAEDYNQGGGGRRGGVWVLTAGCFGGGAPEERGAAGLK